MRFIRKGGKIIPIKDTGGVGKSFASGVASGALLRATHYTTGVKSTAVVGAAALGAYGYGAYKSLSGPASLNEKTRRTIGFVAGLGIGHSGLEALKNAVSRGKSMAAGLQISKVRAKSSLVQHSKAATDIIRGGSRPTIIPKWKIRPA